LKISSAPKKRTHGASSPHLEAVQKLIAARLADVCNVPTILIAARRQRAKMITSTSILPTRRSSTGKAAPVKFYRIKSGLDTAIARSRLRSLRGHDLVETSEPNIERGSPFADAILPLPGKMLAYTARPLSLEEEARRCHHRQLPEGTSA